MWAWDGKDKDFLYKPGFRPVAKLPNLSKNPLIGPGQSKKNIGTCQSFSYFYHDLSFFKLLFQVDPYSMDGT